MLATKTISMADIHRRASQRIALRGYLLQPINFPAPTRDSSRLKTESTAEDSQLVSSWLDDCFVAKAFLKTVDEAAKPANETAPRSREDTFPANRDSSRQSVEVSPKDTTLSTVDRRPPNWLTDVEETVQRINSDLPVHAGPEQHSPVDAFPTRQALPTEEDRFHFEAPELQKHSYKPRFGIRTSIAEDAHLIEVMCGPYRQNLDSNLTGDVIVFSVLDEEMKPLPKFSWVSVAAAGSISSGVLQKGHIRQHAATKLNAESRSLGLWYENWPSKRIASSQSYNEPSKSRQVHVSIILDPYVRVVHKGMVYSLDYSARYHQKVDLSIGVIRKDARSMLGVSDKHELRLFIGDKELVDDRMPLTSLGLNEDICRGFQSLYIFTETVLRYKTCAVCGDEMNVSQFKSRRYTSLCTHEPNTCTPCLQQWIDEALDNKGYDKITCPECSAPFQHRDVKKCATKPQFERYDRLATQAVVSSIPNFRWCLNSRCKSGQIHYDDSPIFVCTACGFKHCVIHTIPWHEGETCADYNYRVSGQKTRDEDDASKKLIDQISKKCPGPLCGANIEKNKGCDHMTCRKCKHEFCWVCMADYGPIRQHGNMMHKTTCRYYTNWGTAGEDVVIVM